MYIHPDIVPLHTLHAGIIRDLEGNPSDDLVNDDLSFFGLREYEYGDDVRNVHWLSTAKTGTLMIRQFEATRRTDSSVSLDVAAFSYASAEEFELAVSVFASIGVQCVSERRALYAAYLGKLGDERALPELMRAASDDRCGYVDYIELRSAIEQLGGELPERDFSDDADFQALHPLEDDQPEA